MRILDQVACPSLKPMVLTTWSEWIRCCPCLQAIAGAVSSFRKNFRGPPCSLPVEPFPISADEETEAWTRCGICGRSPS